MVEPILQSIIDSAKVLKRNFGAKLYFVNEGEFLTVTPKETCLWSVTGQQMALIYMEQEEVELLSCDACDFDDVLSAVVNMRLAEDRKDG